MFFLLLLLSVGTHSSEDVITTGGKSISVFRERGRSTRLEGKSGFLFDSYNRNPPGTWPWAISIGEKNGQTWSHECDGVIISATSIMTSAGCLNDFEDPIYGSARAVETLSVRAGDSHLKLDREDVEPQEIKILSHKKHPKYDTLYGDHYDDVAVVFLSSALNFSTSFVRPAYIPSLEEAHQTTKSMDIDKALAVCGWGGTVSRRGGKLEDDVITSFNDNFCNHVYKGDRLTRNFTDGILCAGSILDLSGTCVSGRGSGIFRLDHSKMRFVLVGLLSSESLDCGTPTTPNIFVRIASRSIITFLYKTIYKIDNKNGAPLQLPPELNQKENNGPYYDTCGTNNIIDAILVDNNANQNMLGRWPWLVPLFSRKGLSAEYKFFCGATILTETTLLTAAHCVKSFNKKTQMKVRAGDVRLKNSNDDSMVQEVFVSHVTRHPNYNSNRYYDLGIIHLKSPLTFNSRVKPVCLLSLAETDQITKYHEVSLSLVTAGWGENNNKIAGENLKQNVASIFSKAICDKTHEDVQNMRSLVPNLFTDDVLCAGDPAGESGTCKGDSGGGAVQFDQNKRRYILRAVISGSKLRECGSWFAPNIYARLSDRAIMEWLFQDISFSAPTQATFDDGDVILSRGREVTYKCTTEANPAPQIIWNLSDDENNEVLFKETSVSYQVSNSWITKSTVHFVVPTQGYFVNLLCTARNVAGEFTNTKALSIGGKKYFNTRYQYIRNFLAPAMIKIDIQSNNMGELHGNGEIELSSKNSTGKAMIHHRFLQNNFYVDYSRKNFNVDFTLRNHMASITLKSDIEHCSRYNILLSGMRGNSKYEVLNLKHEIDCKTYVGGLKYTAPSSREKAPFFEIWQSPLEHRVKINIRIPWWKTVGLDLKLTPRHKGISIDFHAHEDRFSYNTTIDCDIADTNMLAGKNKVEFILKNVRLGYWQPHDRKGLLEYDRLNGNAKMMVNCGPLSMGTQKNFSVEFIELTEAKGSAKIVGCGNQVIGANYHHLDGNVNATLNFFYKEIFLMSDVKSCLHYNYLVRLWDSSEINLKHKTDCNSLERDILYTTPFDFFKKLHLKVSQKKKMVGILFHGYNGNSKFEGKISHDMKKVDIRCNVLQDKFLFKAELTPDDLGLSAKLTGLGKTVLLNGKLAPDRNGLELQLNIFGWKIITLKLKRNPRINGGTIDAEIVFDGKTYSAVVDITKEPDHTYKMDVHVSFKGQIFDAKMDYNPYKRDNTDKKISYSVKFGRFSIKGDYEHDISTPSYTLNLDTLLSNRYRCNLAYYPLDKEVKVTLMEGNKKFQGRVSFAQYQIQLMFKHLREMIKFIGGVTDDKSGIKLEFDHLNRKNIKLELKKALKYNGKDYFAILNVDGRPIIAAFSYALVEYTYNFDFSLNLNKDAAFDCKIIYNLESQVAHIKLSASAFSGRKITIMLDLKGKNIQLVG